MKQFLLFFLSFLLISGSCKKHKNVNPIDQLPPETQTGAEAFGCLVNGQVFKPKGSSLSGPNLSAIYQYLYFNSSSGYVLAVNAADKKDPCNITQIGFRFDSTKIKEGTYLLKSMQKGQGGGGYQILKCSNSLNEFLSNDQIGGQLNLKKFDTVNQIVSGTFWFNAVNEKGDTVKITDGRFDVHYTL
jgi:hypothetical protein